MGPKKFRKKPIVIEAIQLPQEGHDAKPEFVDALHGFLAKADWESDRDEGIAIKTLEGVMRADPGDYIIKGVNGEFYPCKPDIFEKTYDEVV